MDALDNDTNKTVMAIIQSIKNDNAAKCDEMKMFMQTQLNMMSMVSNQIHGNNDVKQVTPDKIKETSDDVTEKK